MDMLKSGVVAAFCLLAACGGSGSADKKNQAAPFPISGVWFGLEVLPAAAFEGALPTTTVLVNNVIEIPAVEAKEYLVVDEAGRFSLYGRGSFEEHLPPDCFVLMAVGNVDRIDDGYRFVSGDIEVMSAEYDTSESTLLAMKPSVEFPLDLNGVTVYVGLTPSPTFELAGIAEADIPLCF